MINYRKKGISLYKNKRDTNFAYPSHFKPKTIICSAYK